MPNFAALYALNASLRYLDEIGIKRIEAHANPLMDALNARLIQMGIVPLCRWDPQNPSGIIAFKHPRSLEIHANLEKENIHVMHNAGRIRVAIHGYNTSADINRFLNVLSTLL